MGSMNDDFEGLPDALKKHVATITEVSLDNKNQESLVESDFKVINFDAVKDHYRGALASNDALFFTWKPWQGCNLFFIEFKNGYIREKDNQHLFDKIYDSVNILSDIVCCNQFECMQVNPVGYLKERGAYILVYNQKNKPYDEQFMTEKTRKGLKQQNYSSPDSVPAKNARHGIGNHLARKAGSTFVLFGLNFFRGYLFKNVYTYTSDDFQKECLNAWEKCAASAVKP